MGCPLVSHMKSGSYGMLVLFTFSVRNAENPGFGRRKCHSPSPFSVKKPHLVLSQNPFSNVCEQLHLLM